MGTHNCVESMLSMATIFMKVKMFHELKSVSSSTSGRRNRNVLKLSLYAWGIITMNSPNLITPWQRCLTLCPPQVKGGRVVVMVKKKVKVVFI